MTTRDHRRHIPIGVKLHACLLLLGFSDEEIAAGLNWDHDPPLGLREVKDGVMIPAPNDPHHLVPMRPDAHREKTNGRPASAADGDIHKIAKTKRLRGPFAEHRRIMLLPDRGASREPVTKKARKIASRPFQTRRPRP